MKINFVNLIVLGLLSYFPLTASATVVSSVVVDEYKFEMDEISSGGAVRAPLILETCSKWCQEAAKKFRSGKGKDVSLSCFYDEVDIKKYSYHVCRLMQDQTKSMAQALVDFDANPKNTLRFPIKK